MKCLSLIKSEGKFYKEDKFYESIIKKKKIISFTILIILWLLKIVVYLFTYSSLYTHVLWILSHFINIYNWTVWSEICLGNNMIS